MESMTDIPNEIREINLAYLLLAQRMLREDREMGMFRLGVSAELADVLGALSIAQVVKIAGSNQLLCRFRMQDHVVLAALAEKNRTVSHVVTHAAVVMSGQPVEQI